MELLGSYRGIVVAIMFSCFLLTRSLAQVEEQECINELEPCVGYLDSNDNPPDSCCKPLDYVIRSMPECLCAMMSIQGANQAQQAGINVSRAQTLPARCGQHINPLGCIVGTPDTTGTRNAVQNGAGSRISSSSLIIAAVVATWMILQFI